VLDLSNACGQKHYMTQKWWIILIFYYDICPCVVWGIIIILKQVSRAFKKWNT
jgi:hypothetical protein